MSVVSGRIGVLGSMFNPPHIGHVILTVEAAWQLHLNRIVWVPTGQPPHRPAPTEPAEMRLRLAQAAATVEPSISVTRVEIDQPGPSYTTTTLRELARRYPAHELVLLLGADQLAMLSSWHEATTLPQLATIAVAPRPGIALAGLEHASVERIKMPTIGVSSTMIRSRVAGGESIRHLVPEPVRELITKERLYRQPR